MKRRFTEHLLALSDACGVLQHARFRVPNRAHGYCTDDNARALIAMCRLARRRPLGEAERAAALSYAAFVDHAFDRSASRLRNFMSYDRRWLEPEGAPDSQARAVWALGLAMARPFETWLGDWARNLLGELLPALGRFESPRACAFILLGLDEAISAAAGWDEAERLRAYLAERLAQRWRDAAREDWPWFEDVLGYDNARLSEAAIRTGASLRSLELRRAGATSLQALWDWQFDGRVFHPVGTESFGKRFAPPARFDQQPVEVAAMVEACIAAARAGLDGPWDERARIAAAWFDGRNDLGMPVADAELGLCHDGMHADRINANAGAESTLAYLLSRLAMVEAGLSDGDEV